MKVPVRVSLNRSNGGEDKNAYADFSHSKLITIFQVPQYEHLQILVCNGNSLTTLAGIEHIRHLWKLDVSNNQIRSLQHLSRFIAFGSLILSNNHLQWIELQHIRHMFILDLRLDGNTVLDADLYYRQHVLDCLPRIWMCDGVFISTSERNQVDEFFTQSSLTTKPVRRKLARDIFMPTNLKDRAVNGLFGSKATELFAKFPLNCFINSELDKKRVKHLASTIQDLLLTEMRYNEEKKQDDLLIENRHTLYHMTDLRQTHVEEFNMLLILLVTDILFRIPFDLLDHVLDVTRIKTIGNLNVQQIFSSSEELKCMIGSLLHAGARLDRDENHPSAFYDKLFNSLSIGLTNHIRQLAAPSTTYQAYPNASILAEAKAMVCLEVMQVFIMCPLFYTLIDNPNVHAILKHALDRSPAYGSIKDVLQSFNNDQKTSEEQKDLLAPILGNILKMTIRTLSTKRTKKMSEPLPVETAPLPESEPTMKRQESAKSVQRTSSTHVPTIGDRILTGPQSFGRIVTLPDSEIAMIQLDHILAGNGSMTSNGTLHDHTNYVNMSNFEWDVSHEFWRPKFTLGDKITLHLTTSRGDSPRSVPLPASPRTVPPKTSDSTEKGRVTPRVFQMNLHTPKEAFVEPIREPTPPVSPPPPVSVVEKQPTNVPSSSSPPPNAKLSRLTSAYHMHEISLERPMSVRIIKQKQEQQTKNVGNGDVVTSSPVLIESTLLLMPDQQQPPTALPSGPSPTMADFETAQHSSGTMPPSSAYRRSITRRVHVPVHNASQWFNGPDMQNERTGRMEKVVASLVRRPFRRSATYAMPRVPTLTSPSSRDHAHYKGVRPESFQDFCLESHRMAATPIVFHRQVTSAKGRFTPTMRLNDVLNRSNTLNQNMFRAKSMFNPPCPTPSWM